MCLHIQLRSSMYLCYNYHVSNVPNVIFKIIRRGVKVKNSDLPFRNQNYLISCKLTPLFLVQFPWTVFAPLQALYPDLKIWFIHDHTFETLDNIQRDIQSMKTMVMNPMFRSGSKAYNCQMQFIMNNNNFQEYFNLKYFDTFFTL